MITNEVSNRATPTLVGFGPKARFLGEGAKTQETSNFKNTVASLKRLVGRSFSDPEVAYEQQFISCQLVDVKGQVGAKVKYLGNEEVFTATQLLAMFLTRAKQTAETELHQNVNDVVISCFGWLTDQQRRAMLDAAEIAGLNPLRLMNETSAAALGYGITKTDLPEDEPRNVVFCDIGHSSYSVAIVSFMRGQLTVRSTAYDRHFGGRNIDLALVNHFAEEFKAKYKIDVKTNQKAMFRLYTAVERLKKVLSANASAPLNVESIMNDIDVSSFLKRQELEELIAGLLERVDAPLESALKEAGMTKDDIHSVEMIGGSTRVPAIKERVSEFFGKSLSFTLNQDEAVSRGCAFACAILSPVFKVREFAVHDIASYPIEFQWEAVPGIDEETSLEVFGPRNPIPSTKVLSFYRKEPFTLTSLYPKTAELPGGINHWIGDYTVKNVQPNSAGDYSLVKVKARINLHGVLAVEQAYVVEEEEVEEPIPEEPSKDGKSDEMAVDAPVKTRKVKKLVNKGSLPIVAGTASLDDSLKQTFREREFEMVVADKLVKETEDRKNALEEYIYDMRGKLDDLYASFASDSEKSKLHKLLDETEEWLYEDGEDTTKAVYVSRMESLLSIGGPIRQRYLDAEEAKRQEVLKAREAAEAKLRKQKEAEEAAKGEQGTGGAAPPPPPPEAVPAEDEEMN